MAENDAFDIETRLAVLDLWRMWRDLLKRYGPRLKDYAELLVRLYPLPDWSDPEDTRKWFRRLAGVCDQLADLTATDIDGNAAKALQVIVESEEAWLAFYTLFASMIPPYAVEASAIKQRAEAIADTAGPIGDLPRINPLLILAIVRGLAELVAFLRDWHESEPE